MGEKIVRIQGFQMLPLKMRGNRSRIACRRTATGNSPMIGSDRTQPLLMLFLTVVVATYIDNSRFVSAQDSPEAPPGSPSPPAGNPIPPTGSPPVPGSPEQSDPDFQPVTPTPPAGGTSPPGASGTPGAPNPAETPAIPVTPPPAKTPATTTRKTGYVAYVLPAEYLDKDKNKDGQIGLYEWPRSEIAAFRKLDLNGDGFLTPFEVLKSTGKLPSKATVVASATPVPGGSAPAGTVRVGAPPAGPDISGSRNGGGNGGGMGGNRGSRGGGPGSPSGDTTPKDPATQRAESAFGLMDRDRNDKIDQEEWTRSRSVRPAFEKANVAVTPPISKSDFVELFKKVNAAQ